MAAGLVPFAIGSETWGSIVTPAGFCGVSGLRPTYGRVSRYGAMALSWTMDKLGPLARSAEDCGLVLAAISGQDPADPTSLRKPFAFPRRPSAASSRTPRRSNSPVRRIGFIREDFPKFGEPEVERAYEQALDTLRAAGMTVEEAKLPDFPYEATAQTIVFRRGVRSLRRFDSQRAHRRDHRSGRENRTVRGPAGYRRRLPQGYAHPHRDAKRTRQIVRAL